MGMSEDVAKLTLVFMRRLDKRLDRMESDIGHIKFRVTATAKQLALMMMSIAGVYSRMGKFDARLARAGRRLDLTDAK